MITDELTNTVYFSKYLTDYKCYQLLCDEMTARGINHFLLQETKDIWARDFMPIQLSENRYMGYKYNPDYLKNASQYITNYANCMPFHPTEWTTTELRIDGGNVIKCANCVIMTDKVLKENPERSHLQILKDLEEVFQTEVVLIPWDTDEPYGHADGMVRYLGGNRVLINNYRDISETFCKSLRGFLEPRFEVEEITFGKDNQSERTWAYLNYLRVGNVVFLPQLGLKTDALACRQIQNLLPEAEIVPIEVATLPQKGGALNCVSWNVKL
jgi:agmatine/peptidylarginine deiminase